VAITEFSISMGDDGEMTSSMRPLIAWEVWPLWLRVAIDHEASASRARRQLASVIAPDDGGRRADLIEEETRACLVAISSVAFAVEAMALSAATKAGLPAGIGQNASAARRVAEVLKQCFAVPPAHFREWRDVLIMVFDARNEAVHPDAGLRDPLPHPGVRAGVPRPAHVYRLENATAAIDVGLWTAATAGAGPRPRLGKPFRESTAAWAQYAADLRVRREALPSSGLA
jgi:hypothetical protein